MTASLVHTQARTNPSDGVYQVTDTVTASTGIPPEVFVFKVADSTFDHVATVLDVVTYPNSLVAASAAGQPFYRLATVTRTFPLVNQAQDFAASLVSRMKTLASQYELVVTVFVGTDTGVTLP